MGQNFLKYSICIYDLRTYYGSQCFFREALFFGQFIHLIKYCCSISKFVRRSTPAVQHGNPERPGRGRERQCARLHPDRVQVGHTSLLRDYYSVVVSWLIYRIVVQDNMRKCGVK